MKDSYSFDLDDEGLQALLRARTAAPTSGSSTGSASTTGSRSPPPARWAARRARSSSPRRSTARTRSCSARTATTPPTPRRSRSQCPTSTTRPRTRRARCSTLRTPRRSTRLVDRLNSLDLGRTFTAADTLKNVVLKTRGRRRGLGAADRRRARRPRGRPEADRRPARAGRGRRRRRADLRARTRSWSRATSGRSGSPSWGIRYVVDPLVVPGSAWVTGANEPDKHAAFVVRGRDFEPAGEIGAVEIRDGDRCARCGGELQIARAIEIGHIFQLGRKYAERLRARRAGPGRRADPDHDGLLRHRRLARGRRGRRADPRRLRAVLAGRDRPVRRPRRPGRPRRRAAGRRDRRLPTSSRPPASGCCSTTATARPGRSSPTPT